MRNEYNVIVVEWSDEGERIERAVATGVYEAEARQLADEYQIKEYVEDWLNASPWEYRDAMEDLYNTIGQVAADPNVDSSDLEDDERVEHLRATYNIPDDICLLDLWNYLSRIIY